MSLLSLRKYIVYIILINLLLLSNISFAQQLTKGQKPDPLFAKYCLKFNNYFDGLHEFKALLKEHPDNDYYRWGIGYCILHLNMDKAASIPYFIKVLSKANANPEYWYDLGEAYMYTNQLDKAEDCFNKYIQKYHNDEHNVPATRMLEMIDNARELMKTPIKVSFTNLGKSINTEYPEFNPLINANEKYLVYSMQNPSNNGKYRHEDGYYAADIYYSNFKFGRWRNRRKFSSIVNSKNIEVGQSMSSNASKLIVYKEDIHKRNKSFYIYTKRGRYFGYPKEILIDGIDLSKANSICLSPDNKYLVFSIINKNSNHKNLDLFYSKYSPEGFWMKPILMDSLLNSDFDESYPYFSPDKHHFYFASKGHNSMGGYDIFVCDFMPDSFRFSSPRNIGYPVNTTMDDKQITFNNSGRYAYKSCLRADGFGDLDIYRIIFKEKPALLSYIHGFILNQDSMIFTKEIERINQHIDTLNFPINREYKHILLKEKDSAKAVTYLAKNKIAYEKMDVNISVINMKDKKSAGKFIVKEKTARFAVILPPGEYKLIFSRKGYQDLYYQKLKVEDYDLRNRDIEMNIILRKK